MTAITLSQKDFLDGTAEAITGDLADCWVFPVDPSASVRVLIRPDVLVPLRRYAYQWLTYEEMPTPASGQSSNRCGTRKCINPTHYRRVDE